MSKNFMKLSNYLLALLVSVSLVACGGGGGNPGTNAGGSGSGSGGGTTTTPIIKLAIVDGAGAIVSSNSIGSGAAFYAKATLTDSTGAPIASKMVTFTTDTSIATLGQSSALTDASGAAKVQISPAGLSKFGAGNLSVSATVNGNPVTADLDFQTTAANVTVTNMKASPTTINALETSSVTVEGRVDGALAGNGVVVVNFSASCGTFSPVSGTTNSAGIVTTTYKSAVTCTGPIALSATAANTTSTTSATVNVAAALPANIAFVAATAPLMVTSTTTGGIKQSTLKFQVLDSSSAGMSGQAIKVDLANAAIAAGVTFFTGSTSTTATQSLTTDGLGFAQVTVTSGAFPTPVIATAYLAGSPTIQASSLGVAVTSGRATQNSASLSATKLAIEGWNTDGVTTSLTMRVADRQANPVPVGTAVNFIASQGLVQGSCLLDSSSQCTVTYTSSGTRINNGRAVILAYLDGEESFIDLNGDNIWQPGEPFYDVGTLFRDDNESGAYDAATEQIVPGGMTGSVACTSVGKPVADSVQDMYPAVPNTCDGTWSSSIRVRKQITIALSTSDANITLSSARTSAGFTVRVADMNGNAMPTGSTVTAKVVTNGATCTVSSVSPNVVRNSPNGGNHDINLDAAADCGAVAVEVTVTTPGAVSTIKRF